MDTQEVRGVLKAVHNFLEKPKESEICLESRGLAQGSLGEGLQGL